jgi:hypothetical protein
LHGDGCGSYQCQSMLRSQRTPGRKQQHIITQLCPRNGSPSASRQSPAWPPVKTINPETQVATGRAPTARRSVEEILISVLSSPEDDPTSIAGELSHTPEVGRV